MKRIKRAICLFVLFTILVSLFNIPFSFAQQSGNSITILFTHDMHDHMLPFKLLQDGRTIEAGGYARLASAIEEEKKADPDSLVLDAGDFSMGTLFQTIFSREAPELRIMGMIGYDAVTFGNHEFDYRAEGLAESLNSARESKDNLPQIVASNLILNSPDGKPYNNNLKDAIKNYGVKDYTVIEKNGVKIGIFGLIGKDAQSCAPMAGIGFGDIYENARRVVEILKQKEKVDLIICLSHSGTSDDKSSSEDEILAKKVPDIDVIISGHTHTMLKQPIIKGNTIIASCGEYCEYLGKMTISKDPKKGWVLDGYTLKQIDGSLKDEPQISSKIDYFKESVQEKYLDYFGLKFDDVIAYSPFNFIPSSNIGKLHKEDTLGNFISDAYVYAVKSAEGANYEPVAASIVPSGTIRDSFVKGDITVSDAFNVSSLGIGKDKIPGYPLISVYLTGKELKTVCEVDASIAPIMPTAQLYMSGISYTFNPNRLIFNRVTDAKLVKSEDAFEKIDDSKLYRVIAGLYSAQMLSTVGKKSFGLLNIVPKTKDGKPITDFEAQIITQRINGRTVEVKEWLAIAEYLKSFDKINGIPYIPEYYNQTHQRKIIDDSKNILGLLKSPNKIALALYSIIVIMIFIIIFIIKSRKSRNKGQFMMKAIK